MQYIFNNNGKQGRVLSKSSGDVWINTTSDIDIHSKMNVTVNQRQKVEKTYIQCKKTESLHKAESKSKYNELAALYASLGFCTNDLTF